MKPKVDMKLVTGINQVINECLAGQIHTLYDVAEQLGRSMGVIWMNQLDKNNLNDKTSKCVDAIEIMTRNMFYSAAMFHIQRHVIRKDEDNATRINVAKNMLTVVYKALGSENVPGEPMMAVAIVILSTNPRMLVQLRQMYETHGQNLEIVLDANSEAIVNISIRQPAVSPAVNLGSLH